MATSNNNLNARISSLVKYILDVKPYHTKLLGFTSEVSFSEKLSLSISDSIPLHTIYHQNVWGSADIPTLAIISDGTDASRTFVIPPTVMPRFSVTDAVGYQTPIGDDQALNVLADGNGDGVPDASYPWGGSPTFSHQLGADSIPVRLQLTSLSIIVTAATSTTFEATVSGSIFTPDLIFYGIPTDAVELRLNGVTYIVDISTGSFTLDITGSYTLDFVPDPDLPPMTDEQLAKAALHRSGVELWVVNGTGRYAVPFHNSSKVRVNNQVKLFGALNEYVVDSSRSFIQFTGGNHPAPSDNIDINLMNSDRLFISLCDPFSMGNHGYDTTPYDTDPYDSAGNADQFTIIVNDLLPGRNSTTFINTQPGTNKAGLESVLIYPSQLDGYIWTLTSDGLFSVAVQQVHPIIGPIERALINEPFDNGKIAFTLRPKWSEYYITPGVNSYVTYDMLLFDSLHYESPPDEADFWPGTDIKTEYGKAIDPLPFMHPPTQFAPLGELRQRDIDGKPQYIFELYNIPAIGTFVELRIEQAKQLNPRLQLSMHEHLRIVTLASTGAGYDIGPYEDYPYDDGPPQTTVFDTDVFSTHEVIAEATTADSYTNARTDELSNLRVTELGDIRILES